MHFYSFQIALEQEPDDLGHAAHSPALRGCLSSGKTIEEAKRNSREAIRQHPEALLAHGHRMSQDESLVHVEELMIVAL